VTRRAADGGPRLTGAGAVRLLLRLFPREFREELGNEMIEFYRDRARAEHHARGWRGVAALWLHTVADVVAAAAAERAADGVRRARAAHCPTHERSDEMLESILHDFRLTLRGMRARPTFAAVILATLALGIGANAAIFSVVNGVLLKPLPYADVGGVVQVSHEEPYHSVSEPEFRDYKVGARTLATVSAYQLGSGTLAGGGDRGDAERLEVAHVSDGFFSILGVRPLLGRTFLPAEDGPNAERVVVLGYGLWRRRFAADPAVVGQTIQFNGFPRTVVGVMPPRFDFPARQVALWAPLRLNYDSLWTRNNHYLTLIARVAPGQTAAAAGAEMDAMAAAFTRDYPETYFPGKPLDAKVTRLADQLLGDTRPYLLALLGAVGFVLLIACANVANLLLARGEVRRKEQAIRTALGATRARIVRQVMTESVVYAVAGGVLGVLLAHLGVRGLLALAPATIPRLDEVRLDLQVLLFTALLSLLTGVTFGLVPSLRGSRPDPADTLKEGGRASSAQGRGAGRARGVLVAAEIALAVVTLTGAGLMLRSLWKLQGVDIGFEPRGVLVARVSLPQPEYDDARAATFYRELLARAAALPGVRAAGAVADLPVGDGFSFWSIMLDGKVVKTIAEAPGAMPQQVTPDYFRAMAIPVVRGRAFTEADREGAPPVAVVNETMAKQFWPDDGGVGHTLKMFNEQSPWVTIVGVVKDVRSAGPGAEVPPTMYFPHAQAAASAHYAPRTMNVVIRGAADPLALAGPLRDLVRQMDRGVPVSRVETMESIVAEAMASRRFSTTLLATFAVLAALLAGIGIYGVISFIASQRAYEIGLRMALGAERRQVVGLMVGQGTRFAAAGVVVGLAGAVAMTRLLKSMLVGVTALDPVTLTGVVVAIGAVAVVASWLPAWRATMGDPMRALREG
jgi:putative ABC transport system permease protein